MTAQIISFNEPQKKRPSCSFCGVVLLSGDVSLASNDQQKYMCVRCITKAKQRMEHADAELQTQ